MFPGMINLETHHILLLGMVNLQTLHILLPGMLKLQTIHILLPGMLNLQSNHSVAVGVLDTEKLSLFCCYHINLCLGTSLKTISKTSSYYEICLTLTVYDEEI